MNLSNLSVKARLFATLAFLSALTMTVGVIGYRMAGAVAHDLQYSYDNYFVAEAALGEIVSRQRGNTEQILLGMMARTPEGVSAARARIEQNRDRINELWTRYEKTIASPEERQLADAFHEGRAELIAANNETLKVAADGDYDAAAQVLRTKVISIGDLALAAGDKLFAFQGHMAEELNAAANKQFQSGTLFIGASVVFAVALSIVLGWLLVRSIVNSLSTAMAVTARIAGGELGRDIDIQDEHEFGQLLMSLKAMDGKLGEIVGSVRTNADAVGTAAREISQGNDDLSQRTQQQAAALEETAASMEEMAATVKQNADNAKQANQLAISARGQADKGGAVVQQAIGAMSEINASSRKIADIISVIDEIAFQTNLLALNAAVEAARAGEQGRGFAVVASEVRNLAQRSATAAKEIKGLINDSVEKVRVGAEFVDESGKMIAEIMDSVKKVTDIVAEIAAASEEQATGVEQVNKAVTQMDEVTQQNAALVEEAAAAAKSMQMQTQELVSVIGYFSSSGNRSAPAAHSAHQGVSSPASVSQFKPQAQRKSSPVRASNSDVAPVRLAKASGGGSGEWQDF